jgi:small subunit ribosomal protein S21
LDKGCLLWYRPPLFAARPAGGLFRPCRTKVVEYRGDRVIVTIVVRDNNVEQALRALKKKMQREGTFREMKRRKYYEKPSERRARQKAEAVRRARKLQRKKMQREGLL